MAFWQGLKAAFVSGKIWLLGFVFVGVYFIGFYSGRNDANEDNIIELREFVEQERKRSSEDIVAAVAATKLIQVVKEQGREQIEQMEKLVADGGPDNCIPTDDELRLLREISEGQKGSEGVLPAGRTDKKPTAK